MRSKKKKKQEEDDDDKISFPTIEFFEKNSELFDISKPYVKTYQFEDRNPSDAEIFIKHPQKLANRIRKEQISTLPNNFVTEDEISTSLMGIFFCNSRIGFTYENNCVMTKENPDLALLETFVFAFKVGIYPPLEIMEYLAVRIGNFLKNEGKLSLDEAFGIKLKRGEGTLFGQEKKHRRDLILAHEMGKLIHFFGVTPDEAATMISAALVGEEGKPNHYIARIFPTTGIKPLQPTTIKDIYNIKDPDESIGINLPFEEKFPRLDMNPENKQTYISLFPYLSLPEKENVRFFHSDHKKRFHDR